MTDNAPSPTEPATDPAADPCLPENFLVTGDRVSLRREGETDVTVVVDGEPRLLGGVAGAFPLTRPNKMIALRDEEGDEIAILADARQLDDESRQVLREALDRAYFMPRIIDIYAIDEDMNIVHWDVATNRGERLFQVRGIRRNVRRIGERRFIIKDVDGNRYEIRDWMMLPPNAQKLIEPYL
jgi:hypothetical protein